MYVCMYACMCACMYARVCVCVNIYIYIYIYVGSGQNTLSRSLYKTTYLIVGVYMVKTTRGVTQLGLHNPLVGARTALAWH